MLVTVAHLVERKRHADVIRALWTLRERHPSCATGSSATARSAPRLERLAGELGVAERVEFTGQLEHAAAIEAARAATLFVMPSVDEAFGVAYVEAMAGWVPAVAALGEPGPAEIAARRRRDQARRRRATSSSWPARSTGCCPTGAARGAEGEAPARRSRPRSRGSAAASDGRRVRGRARVVKPVLLVTGHVPPDRVGAMRALHEREGIEIAIYDGRLHHATAGVEDPGVPFRRVTQWQVRALAASGDFRAVDRGSAGRIALPAAYLGARRARVPFLYWSGIWAQLTTPAHLAAAPLLRRIERRADAVIAYGPHVARLRALARRAQRPHRPSAGRRRVLVGPPTGAPRAGRRPASSRCSPGATRRARVLRNCSPPGARRGRRADAALVPCGRAAGAGAPAGRGDGAAAPARARPARQLRNFYAAADVLVVPSVPTRSFREPWGLVVNEAMLQGTCRHRNRQRRRRRRRARSRRRHRARRAGRRRRAMARALAGWPRPGAARAPGGAGAAHDVRGVHVRCVGRGVRRGTGGRRAGRLASLDRPPAAGPGWPWVARFPRRLPSRCSARPCVILTAVLVLASPRLRHGGRAHRATARTARSTARTRRSEYRGRCANLATDLDEYTDCRGGHPPRAARGRRAAAPAGRTTAAGSADGGGRRRRRDGGARGTGGDPSGTPRPTRSTAHAARSAAALAGGRRRRRRARRRSPARPCAPAPGVGDTATTCPPRCWRCSSAGRRRRRGRRDGHRRPCPRTPPRLSAACRGRCAGRGRCARPAPRAARSTAALAAALVAIVFEAGGGLQLAPLTTRRDRRSTSRPASLGAAALLAGRAHAAPLGRWARSACRRCSRRSRRCRSSGRSDPSDAWRRPTGRWPTSPCSAPALALVRLAPERWALAARRPSCWPPSPCRSTPC